MNDDGGKILDFERDADFYYVMALDCLDGGRIPDAFPLLRKAITMDPVRYEYRTALARAYSMVCRYNESNGIILELFKNGWTDGECFFIIGFNFLNLGDTDKALECLNRYLSLCPDGEHVPGAVECIQTISELMHNEETDNFVLHDAEEDIQKNLADEGFQYIMNGDPGSAISVLERVNSPCLTKAKADLALAYLFSGRKKDAYETVRDAVEKNSGDVQLLCSAALLCREMGREKEAAEYVRMLLAVSDPDPDDGFKITDVLSDFGMHAEVYEKADMFLEFFPYSEELVFKKAVAAYRLGKYDEASCLMGSIIKINPDDIVASFYLGILNSGGDLSARGALFSYDYALPRAESIRRTGVMMKVFERSDSEKKRMWTEDRDFRMSVKWGIESLNDEFRMEALKMLGEFHSEDAVKILKDFLLDPVQSNQVKEYVFSLLRQNGVSGPYYAFMDGHAVEVSFRKKKQ